VKGSPLGPITLLVVALAVDAWVFLDARRRSDAGDAVVATVGPVTVSSPEQWLLACVFLWIFAVPLYLVARRAEGP
jgi:hypothetical protein